MHPDAFHDEVLRRLDRLDDWMQRHDEYCRTRDAKLVRLEEQMKARTGWGAVAVVLSYLMSMFGVSQTWPGGKP